MEESALETIATPKAGKARRILLRRLIDVVATPSSQISVAERSMTGDILLDMLFHADEEMRKLCARRLVSANDAPRRLLRYLGQCSFDIASPLLAESKAFDAADLIEISQLGTPEHRLAVVNRKQVPSTVSLWMANNAEPHIARALVENENAVLPEQAVDLLVARSKTEEGLSEVLIERPELTPGHAMAMFWWVDGPLRRTILRRHASDRSELIEQCADIFEMMAEEKWQDPVARKSLQLIERRQRNRAAIEKSPFDDLESAINSGISGGMSPFLAQEIGYLAGIKPITIAKILSDKGGEGLAVLCKATGLHRDFIKVLWSSLKRPFELEPGKTHPQFITTAETYEFLSVAKAQTVLRYWNWSLSSAYSPDSVQGLREGEEAANQQGDFSTARRTASLVFGS